VFRLICSKGCLSRRHLRLNENARHPQETQRHLNRFLRRSISREGLEVQDAG
jgi:hypothetical protein